MPFVDVSRDGHSIPCFEIVKLSSFITPLQVTMKAPEAEEQIQWIHSQSVLFSSNYMFDLHPQPDKTDHHSKNIHRWSTCGRPEPESIYWLLICGQCNCKSLLHRSSMPLLLHHTWCGVLFTGWNIVADMKSFPPLSKNINNNLLPTISNTGISICQSGVVGGATHKPFQEMEQKTDTWELINRCRTLVLGCIV